MNEKPITRKKIESLKSELKWSMKELEYRLIISLGNRIVLSAFAIIFFVKLL